MEVLNGGSMLRLIVAVEECDQIEAYVNKEIKVTIGRAVIIGDLDKVMTKKIRNKDSKEIDIYKEIFLKLDRIEVLVGGEEQTTKVLIRMPDNQAEFFDQVKIDYA
jgi:hypothetical protein